MKRSSALALFISLLFLYLLIYDPAPLSWLHGSTWREAFLTSRVNWREVGRLLVHLRPAPTLGALATLVFSLLVRAWRWQVIARPLDRVPLLRMFHLTNLGYMANNLLPMRLGEVLRGGALAARSRVTVPGALATIVLERVLDFIGVMAVLLAMLFSLRDLDGAASLASPQALSTLGRFRAMAPVLGLAGACGLALLLSMVFWRTRSLVLMESLLNRLLPARPAARLHRIFASFSAGLDILRSPWEALLLLGQTTLLYACYLGSLEFMIHAYGLSDAVLHQQAPLASVLLVLVFTSLGYMIPAAPGAFGTVQYFTMLAAVFIGAGPEQALSFAFGNYIITWLVLTALGLVALPLLKLRFSDLMQWKEKGA